MTFYTPPLPLPPSFQNTILQIFRKFACLPLLGWEIVGDIVVVAGSHWPSIQTQSPLHQNSPFPCSQGNWYLQRLINQEIQKGGIVCFANNHLRAGSTGLGFVFATTHQHWWFDTWMLERLSFKLKVKLQKSLSIIANSNLHNRH